VNACNTCRYFLHSQTKAGDYVVNETRCAVKLMDPVSGIEGEPECIYARTWPHHCGWEGRFWRAKDKQLPGLGG
jgi:hypothetical protein